MGRSPRWRFATPRTCWRRREAARLISQLAHALLQENRVLVLAVGASLSAQLLKVLTHLGSTGRWDWSRAWGAGGLPSSHSAMVTALATGLGYQHGFDSGLFAIAAVFALIVLYDAMGIRHVVGHQGQFLNRLQREGVLASQHPEHLPELVGHTLWEVLAGVAWGVAVVAVLY